MHLHPLAYAREAERLNMEAKRAANLGELNQSKRLARLALDMKRRAN